MHTVLNAHSKFCDANLDPRQMGLRAVAAKHDGTRTVVHCGGHAIGDGALTLITGPCAVESEAQIDRIAASVKAAGAQMLRGGAVKPRTSPYAFQGLGPHGWAMLAAAGKRHALATVSEVMDVRDLDVALQHIDMVQVGARNMQHIPLLKALGDLQCPVLLKRHPAATYREWLLAAEYIVSRGNPNVVLCERGIRSFEPSTRFTFDLAAVPVIKTLSHLPVVCDPSHGTGLRSLVPPMAKAAVAAGADGVMLEVHHSPDASQSDAKQALATASLPPLLQALKTLHQANALAG